MNNLATLSKRILEADDYPLLIRLPAWSLIRRLLLFFFAGTALLTMSFTLLAIVAIPVLVYWGYLYALYCHVWKRYCLSRFYTRAAVVCAVMLSIGLRIGLYFL